MKQYFSRLFYWIFRGVPITHVNANVVVIQHSNRLSGKKVLITGGGHGLGFFMAQKFIESGAQVVILGRNEQKLKEASAKLNNCGYIRMDVRNYNEYDRILVRADEMVGGGLNCLINNAGISLHERSFQDVSIECFNAQFDTNVKSPYFLSQKFIDYAQKRNIINLNIIFISSERALYGDILPYGLTKAAINSLTAGLARYYVKQNIRVNAIAPGVTCSDLVNVDKTGNIYRERSAGNRFFLPEEVAEIAAFLLSDESACITGEIIPCNQGNHLRSDY